MSASEDVLPNVMLTFEFENEKKKGLPSLEPYEFHLQEALSKPYRLQVSLVARDPSIEESELVGQACTLTMERAGLVRYINGIVLDATFSGVALDAMTPEGNLPNGLIHLTVVPALELLKQRRNNRIFQLAKVTDVLKIVLEKALTEYGREVVMKTSSLAYKELEYCTQFDETDFEFVQRLMATHGIMSYFVQEEKVEKLVLFDTADRYLELVTLNHGKVPFETQFEEGNIVETVSRFTMDTRLTPTTATVRAFNWSNAGAPDETPSKGKDRLDLERELYLGEAPVTLHALGDGTKNTKEGAYAETSAENQSKLIRETAVARTNIAKADGNVSGMSPGVTFELDNALRNDLNRKYLVINASHRGIRPGDRRQGTFNGEVGEVMYTNSVQCVPSSVLFRLPTPPRRFIQTMQTALVVGSEDVTTDIHGRIKVRFHWDREGENSVNSSCWMRVAQASSGIGFGCVFIPRRGQEVVVAFLEGDPDKPLVIGSVYNSINTPPYKLPKERTRSVIRTQSTPKSGGYNEISFEDNDGHEEFKIQAQKDMKEVIKNDHTLTIGNDEVLRVGDDSEGGETKKGNRTRWVKNDEVVDIGGNRTRTVKKDETVTIGGNRTLTIGGDGPAKSVVDVTGTHTLDASDTIKVEAPNSITLKCGESTIVMEPGKITLTAGGKASLVLDSSVEATSAPGSSLKLSTDAAMEGKMNASVKGTMEAAMSAAASSVKASPTGVETSGPKVDVSGTAMVSVSAPMVTIN